MNDEALVVGIDIGTSGVRVAALSRQGDPVAEAQALLADEPRSPLAWWRAVEDCFAHLKDSVALGSVVAVAVDGTSGTLLAVDEAGKPVMPPSMYHDVCADEAILQVIEAAAPTESPVRGRSSALARALQLQRKGKVAHLLHQADWIAGRIAGRYGFSDFNNALKTGYDPVNKAWPDWLDQTGIERSLMPAVFAPGLPISPVGQEGIALGLPADARVHLGTTDGCASFLATGASQIGEGVTALGSTLVLKLLSDCPISAPQYGIYSHRLAERWLVGGASNSGGSVIAHLFAKEEIERLTASLQPEAPTGLHYYPLVKPGERFPIHDPALEPQLQPRPEADAVFFQGVLEGIADIEALGYRRLAELGSPKLVSVRSVGGGARNAGWTAIRQARLGVPFLPALSREACVGVARLALDHLDAPTLCL